VVLAGEGTGDPDEHGRQHLSAEEPERGVEQPHPGGRPVRRAGSGVELQPEGDIGWAEAAGGPVGDGGTGIGCRLGWCARSRGIHRLFGPVAHSPTIPTAPPGGVPGPTVGVMRQDVPVARSMKR